MPRTRAPRHHEPTDGAAVFAALLGCAVLLGRAMGTTGMGTWLPGQVAMKPNTAVCFVLLGAAVVALHPAAVCGRRRIVGLGILLPAGVLALATLAEYVLQVHLGIDQAVFPEPRGATATSDLGRMAPSTCVAVLLLVAGLAAPRPTGRWSRRCRPACALGAAVLAGVALVGYLTGVTSLYGLADVTQMAIPTTVGLLALSIGMLRARPHDGPMRLLSSRTAGGKAARLLIPAAILTPVAAGALGFAGQRAGLYGPATEAWLLVVTITGLTVPLCWALGASLDRSEREQWHDADHLRRDARCDRVAFDEAPIGSVVTDRHARVERVNQALCSLTGFSPDELVGRRYLDLIAPDDRQRCAEVLAAMLRGGPLTSHLETRYLHRDGWAIEAQVVVTLLREHGEEAGRFFAQVEDVTDARRTSRELAAAQLEMLARLAAAAEFHDDHTGEHTRRVGDLSAQIARQLALPASQVELLRTAAPLHDIGKIAIPDALLSKRGPLTAEEYDEVKTHTTTGALMLTGSTFALLRLAERIALTHHEKWDGSGYPDGLAGEDIPLAGRIVAVADVFDALTHGRPYKEPWSTADALAEMTSQSGRHFDPRVLEAFLSLQHAPVTTTR